MPLTFHTTELEVLRGLWFYITSGWCQENELNPRSLGKEFILLFRKCDVKLKEADEQTQWVHKAGPSEMHYTDV